MSYSRISKFKSVSRETGRFCWRKDSGLHHSPWNGPTDGLGAQPTQIISWALIEWNHAPVHVRLYKTKRILVDQSKSVYYFSVRPRLARSYPNFFFGFSAILKFSQNFFKIFIRLETLPITFSNTGKTVSWGNREVLCYTAVLYHQVPPPIDALSCYPVQNMHLHAIALLKGLLEVNTSFFYLFKL